MKSELLVSIIIPVYKVEKYLPACLDSILAQTYQNFEVILVDDESPDNCWNIMQEYAQKDKRIRPFQKKNGGVSSARNYGMDVAQGDYITFIDADDLVARQYLEWLCQVACSQHEIIVACRRQIVTSQKIEMPLLVDEPEKRIFRLEECFYGGTLGVNVQCWGVLYQHELVKDLRFEENISIGEDTLFFCEAFLRAGRYTRLESELYYYVQTEESAYRSKFTARKYSEIEAWERICERTKTVPGRLNESAEEKLLIVCSDVYYAMLDAHYPDKEMRRKLVEKVHQRCELIKNFQAPPQWKAWRRAKLLSMLYLPAWFNGPFWRKAEQLRAWRQHAD